MTLSQRWWIAVLLVLACGLISRVFVCFYGLPYVLFPDEPTTASRAIEMLQEGRLDPAFYRYGSLLTYLCMAADWLTAQVLMTLPSTHPSAIGSLAEIIPGGVDGSGVAPSHPIFYLINRLIVTLMGAGSVALVARIGLRLIGPWAGAAAAALLAAAPAHMSLSAQVINDAPAVFFSLGTAAAVLWSLESGRREGLWLGGLCAGLAAGCKLTGGSALVVVGAALVLGPRTRKDALIALLLAPISAFAITNPFAVLHPMRFVGDISAEASHYLIEGHDQFTTRPGLDYLTTQLSAFLHYTSWPAALLGLLGLGLSLRMRRGWLLWLLPLTHLLGMSFTRVSFHRNLLIVYPFAALWGALALTWVHERARHHHLVTAIMAVWLGGTLLRMTALAHQAMSPEPRTAMMQQVAARVPEVIGVPMELRVAPRSLPSNALLMPLSVLTCDDALSAVVIPGAFTATQQHEHAAWLNTFLPPGVTGGDFSLDSVATQYTLQLVPPPLRETCAGRVPLTSLEQPSGWELHDDGLVHAYWNGEVRIPLQRYPAGTWRVTWEARGTPVAGEGPRVRLQVADESNEVVVGETWEEVSLTVTLTSPDNIYSSLFFLNDVATEHADRNLFIRGVRVEQLQQR